MPPPGWYDDPEQSFTWRYWDGARWSEHRSPMWVPPARDPKSFSAWFERSFACVKVVTRRVGLVLVALWAVASLFALVAGVVLFTSTDGRELRELTGLDDSFGTSNALTDSQADRAGELFGDLFVAAIPWIVVVALIYLFVGTWSWAIVARVAANHLAESDGAAEGAIDVPVESVGATVGVSLRRIPAVIGSSLGLGLVFFGLVVVAAVPIAVVVALDLGAAAVVLTVLFVIAGAIALGGWLWGRLALAPVIAALGGHGVGLRRSWEATHGRFWYVIARVIVALLIAGALGQAVNLVANFAFFLDFVVLLAISLVIQTVVSVISTVIQVSAMVVVLDQVSDFDDAHDSGLVVDAPW
jgi:hypothetical protein